MSEGTRTQPALAYAQQLEQRLRQLRELREVQYRSRHGGQYMRGLYNGLELAVATIEGREPNYEPAGNWKG